ncbi:MAG: site-specific integrase [Polyangiaceae bacterium]
MPRPRTGYVEPHRRASGAVYFLACIRLADGSKERVRVPRSYSTPSGGRTARERADLYAEARQEREDETGELLAKRNERRAEKARHCEEEQGETCAQYFRRFLEHRAAAGKVRRLRDLRSAWDVWIASRIGRKPIASLTRDDVEDVRDALDCAVAARKREGGRAGLSGARARNVWSVLTSLMKEACTSKRRDLRVRADNPCTTVQPPDKTDAKTKTFIYPMEFLKLVSCEEVPVAWRQLYVVACYLYLRPGELRALRWSDVDFDAGVIHVTKAYDEDSQTTKPPKTRNGVRDVPIPAALVPLLKVMRNRAADDGAPVMPLMAERSENLRSIWMRKHLARAKVTRSRLTEQSATTMKVNFRTWRDTGITWLALAGVDVAKMQRRAGHDTISTTLGYVKVAEDLSGKIGEPFPPLPVALLTAQPNGPSPIPRKPAKTHAPASEFSPGLNSPPQIGPEFAERAGFEPAAGF